MTRITINKDDLRKFIQCFGHNVDDLLLDAKEFSLVGGVAMPTHFLTTRISATVDEAGQFAIADISKVVAFLRACDGNSIEMWQKPGRPLHLSNGGTEMTLPCAEETRSAKSLPMVMKLVAKSGEDNWKSWSGEPLDCYGRLENCNDLLPVSQMQRVVGKGREYYTRFGVGKLTVSAGKKVETQMSVTVDLLDADGPPTAVDNTYGPWLPHLLNVMPTGPCEIYTGAGSVLVLNHVERECLLVVIPQGE